MKKLFLVEVIPVPWTPLGAVEKAVALMKRIGQVPIRLSCEIAGFVINRLQSAILGKVFRLVEDGICSVTDIDVAVKDGLGLRWFFIGPFETIDLNASHRVTEYCLNYKKMCYGLAKEQANSRRWSGKLIAEIEKQRRTQISADKLDARRAWRDRCLAVLIKIKRTVFAEDADWLLSH
jgi:3-hydroxyacyl-CoA dehydrogenase